MENIIHSSYFNGCKTYSVHGSLKSREQTNAFVKTKNKKSISFHDFMGNVLPVSWQ